MPSKRKGPRVSVDRLAKLRAVVKAIATTRHLSERDAYAWLCSEVFGRHIDPTALRSDQCDELIAWRLVA